MNVKRSSVTVALKNMRNAKGLSLIKTSQKFGVKEALVTHYENGCIVSSDKA
jgi:predicted transcriptional regulator